MDASAKIRALVANPWIWMSVLVLILLSFAVVSPADAAPEAGFCFNANPGTIPDPEFTLELLEGAQTPVTFTVQLCDQPGSRVKFVANIRNSANMPATSHF